MRTERRHFAPSLALACALAATGAAANGDCPRSRVTEGDATVILEDPVTVTTPRLRAQFEALPVEVFTECEDLEVEVSCTVQLEANGEPVRANWELAGSVSSGGEVKALWELEGRSGRLGEWTGAVPGLIAELLGQTRQYQFDSGFQVGGEYRWDTATMTCRESLYTKARTAGDTLALDEGRFDFTLSWKDTLGNSGFGVPIRRGNRRGGFGVTEPGEPQFEIRLLDQCRNPKDGVRRYVVLVTVDPDIEELDLELGVHDRGSAFGEYVQWRPGIDEIPVPGCP